MNNFIQEMGGSFAGLRQAFAGRIFLTKVFVFFVFSALLFSTEGWEAKSILFEESLYFVGVVMVAVCLVGRAWSLSYISGNKNDRLVSTGPYSLCRNPLYFSNFIGAVGLGLCTETLTVTAMIIFVFALYYPRVILGEERRLQELFGAEFKSYCERVPRFLPSLKFFSEDEKVLVSARAFRNGLRDLGALVLAVGLIEFVEALHKAHVLPNFFVLY